MDRYVLFRDFLEEGWSKSTVNHYAGAIKTISNELYNLDLIDCDIYLIKDIKTVNSLLELYLSIDELEKKDIRGNRMYSNAIKRYVEFFSSLSFNENISKDTSRYDTIEDSPQTKNINTDIIIQKKVNRDSKVSGNAIVNTGYKCEYDPNHYFFHSRSTNRAYVEAHHLIPMSAYDDFDYGIDVQANVISLCVVCHKKLHHATIEEKLDILRDLYNKRSERLEKCNIKITFENLVKYYS